MKKLLLCLVSMLIVSVVTGQNLKEYFLPSSRYFDKTFEYTTFDAVRDGVRRKGIHEVLYYWNRNGGYKKYVIEKTYVDGRLESSFVTHNFFEVNPKKVASVGYYTESPSDHLLPTSWIDSYHFYDVILKPVGSTWKDVSKSDEGDVYTTVYKINKTSITTDYGVYNDVIEVVEKSTDTYFYNVEYTIRKKYYAKGIGLVKEIRGGKGVGKKLKWNKEFTVVLQDNFSYNSFYKKRKREEEAKRLRAFKLKVVSDTFDYRKEMPDEASAVKEKLTSRFDDLYNAKDTAVDVKFSALLFIDSTGKVKADVNAIRGVEKKAELKSLLEKTEIENAYLRYKGKRYPVNSTLRFYYRYRSVITDYEVKALYNEKGVDVRTRLRPPNLISDYLENNLLPEGRYKIGVRVKTINRVEFRNLEVKEYKSFSGAMAVVPSLVIPGLGKRWTTGRGKSGVGITLACYTLVGGGILSRIESNRNYDLYRKATNQEDIDKYYEEANFYYKTSYQLLTTGAILWGYNLYKVYKRGRENTKDRKYMKSRLTPSVGYLPNRKMSIGLTYNF